MKQKIYLTKEGYEKIKKELKTLKDKEPEIIKEVQRMAAMGDRSENAGYQNAKSLLRRTQSRIFYLERLIKVVKVIEEKIRDKVEIGATVTLLRLDINKEEKYTIVDTSEINLIKGYISLNSPLGRVISNKVVNDTVNLLIHNKAIQYKIVEIK